MAWVKLDDAMPTHPKLMAAGPTAFALDVAGLCYSNKHATDGFIAAYALPAVLPGLPSPKRVAAKLVEVERWVEVDGGWLIHDVHDYQPTAEHQKELSKTRAEVGRKGGSKSPTHAQANGKQSTKQVASGSANPVPSRPVPEGKNPPSDKPDEVDDEFESFWTAYPRHHDTKALGGGGVKKAARKAWDRLSRKQRDDVIAALEPYAKVCRPDGQKPKNAERFLKNDAWTPYLPAARDGPRGRPCPECDRDLDKPDHDELCAIFSGKELV